jgi:hypothetical protein
MSIPAVEISLRVLLSPTPQISPDTIITVRLNLTANSLLRTPGAALEARLNREYGPGNVYYEDFCRYMRQGLKEGWVAQGELDGPRYRRGRIAGPSEESLFISITTVYVSFFGLSLNRGFDLCSSPCLCPFPLSPSVL